MADDPTPPTNDDPTPPSPTPPADDGDKPLGDAGEKALEAWKQRAKAAESDAKRAKALETELADLKAQQMTESEKAIADARQEAIDATRSEVLGSVNRKLFSSELKAIAVATVSDPDLLSDPDVAMRLLDLDEIPVTDNGDIDTEAISEAIGRLVESKPYLAVGAMPTPPPPMNQGPRTQSEPVDPEKLTDPAKVREWADSNRRKRF